MIWIASCGYLLVTSVCSASAVCFADAPGAAQRHRVRQVDQQAHRRRRAPLGLERPRSRRPSACTRPPGAGRSRRGAPRCVTVRTTSSGCSSPNRHGRLAPVSSPAWPASALVVVAAAGRRRAAANTRRSAVSPSRRTAFGVSSSVAAACAAGSPAAPARARCGAARRRSSTACRPSARRDGLLVDVVEPRARVVLAERAPPARRGRRAPASAVVASPMPSGSSPVIRSRPPPSRGRAGAPQRVGRAAPSPWRARRPRMRLLHQPGQLRALLGRQRGASAVRPPRRGGRASRPAPRGSAGCRGRSRRTPAMNSVELLLGVLAARVRVEHRR